MRRRTAGRACNRHIAPMTDRSRSITGVTIMNRKIRLNCNSSHRATRIAGLTGLAIAVLTAVSLTSMAVSAQSGLGGATHAATASTHAQQAPKGAGELRPAISETRTESPRQVRVIPLFNTPDDQKNLLRR